MKMKRHSITISSLFCTVLILWSLATLTIAQEEENQSDFSYIMGSQNGPQNWGDIKEEWATCKTGILQSPIGLPTMPAVYAFDDQQINKSYIPGNAILKNRGHDLAVEWPQGNSKITLDGKEYILRQCHWHQPSEHLIEGNRFALELHLVHISEDNEIAVIGQVYTLGESSDPFLSKLTEKINETINGDLVEVDAGVINPAEIDIGWDGHFHRYYRYMGSLTTPPCTEGVIWTINEEPKTVSLDQVVQLREAVNDDMIQNARPLQPTNERNIHLYFDILLENESENTVSGRSFI